MPKNYFEKNGAYIIAMVAGLAVGWFDLLRLSWVVNGAILIISGAALGYFFDQHPRSLAFTLGFGPFLLQLCALMFDLMPSFKQNLFFSLLALIPSFIGVYTGYLMQKSKRK